MRCCNAILLGFSVLGAVLIILGAVLGFKVLPDYVHEEIKKSTELLNGTAQYKRFKELPFPLDFKVYFFNVLNPEDIMIGKTPKVEEVGPFTYKKTLKKENIYLDKSNDKITFTPEKKDAFSLKDSMSDEEYSVTVLNTPMLGIFHIFETMDVKMLTDAIAEKYTEIFDVKPNTLFHDIKIKEYTLEGYKFCNKDNIKSVEAKAICAILRLLRLESMKLVESRTISFSFFDQKQGQTDGTYTIGSGLNDINTLGNIYEWKGKSRISDWDETGTCNDVRGTDSTIFPPFNDKDTIFPVFNTDICRSIEMQFKEEIEYKGIQGYRSTVKRNTLHMDETQNECYCILKTKNLQGERKCLPNGFMDMYNCLGAPIILSFPHFLWADETYAKTVSGLQPSEAKHQIFVDMEPVTGSPLRGHKRVQFNMIARELTGLPFTKQLLNSIIPILWVDEGVAIPQKLVDELNEQYFDKLPLVEVTKWLPIGLGIVMFIGFGGLFFYRRKRSTHV